ncbi:hypothetical protein DF107_09090 [Burkholderia stagnalis]|uniref:hypothetical protein n=1 Tax=Burkholderia stagnalis TaxID=1503054 RepID=UPI000F5A85E9|nr:hypothetical protein [Burkholderia stagnalis]RQQ13294.1 hypothetical protein DF161_20520 [Burkholderia stagnalis]RQR03965.1 hypothetical protein DF031_04475 [Burkholderia stagnalis]RQX93771.1 hypothetical protein DF120_10225 [Burkholderia stagnalis]RQY83007.1 hypothetical protein DF107_09090 [Burkholderia stagnalis]
MLIENLSSAVAAAQACVSELEAKLADAQKLVADLATKRADAAERAEAALQGARSGDLTEAVAGLRHALALQDANDLDVLIEQGQSTLNALINDVFGARDSAQRAQAALAAEERRQVTDGLKARLEQAEANLLRAAAEAYRVHAASGGSGSIRAIWWPSQELADMVMQGSVPRR